MQEYTRKKAKDAKKINTRVKELVEGLLYYFSQPGFFFMCWYCLEKSDIGMVSNGHSWVSEN